MGRRGSQGANPTAAPHAVTAAATPGPLSSTARSQKRRASETDVQRSERNEQRRLARQRELDALLARSPAAAESSFSTAVCLCESPAIGQPIDPLCDGVATNVAECGARLADTQYIIGTAAEFDAFAQWAAAAGLPTDGLDAKVIEAWGASRACHDFAAEAEAFLAWAGDDDALPSDYEEQSWELFRCWRGSSAFRRWRFNRSRSPDKEVGPAEWDAFEAWEAEEAWLCADDCDELTPDAEAAWEEAFFAWRDGDAGTRWCQKQSASEWLADPTAQGAADEAEQVAAAAGAAAQEEAIQAAVAVGAPDFEWARVDVDGLASHHTPDGEEAPRQWQLLARASLAGRRHKYDHFEAFTGDVEAARLHLHMLASSDDDGDGEQSAARAWLRAQREQMVRQLPQARWELPTQQTACLRLTDDGGHCTTVVQSGNPARPSAFMPGGVVRGLPVVRGGVHEFTLCLTRTFRAQHAQRLRRPALPPLLGISGNSWAVYFNPADGLLYVHDTTPRADGSSEDPRKLRDQDRREMHEWEAAMDAADVSWCQREQQTPRVRASGSSVDGPVTVRIRVDFTQRELAFAINSEPESVVRTGVLDLHVPGGFHPKQAAPCVKLYCVELLCEQTPRCHHYHCVCKDVPLDVGTAVSLQAHRCLVPSDEPVAAPPVDSQPQLVMGIDPEGDIPYFYTEGDTERHLAITQQMYEPRQSSAPSWFVELTGRCVGLARRVAGQMLTSLASAAVSAFVPTGEPAPRKTDYPFTESGIKRFRDDRADWYERRTGRKLEGTEEEQWRAVDNASRFSRARGTSIVGDADSG